MSLWPLWKPRAEGLGVDITDELASKAPSFCLP